MRVLSKIARDYFGSLLEHGTTEPFLDRMASFSELNEIIGTPDMIAKAVRYYAGDGL